MVLVGNNTCVVQSGQSVIRLILKINIQVTALCIYYTAYAHPRRLPSKLPTKISNSEEYACCRHCFIRTGSLARENISQLTNLVF